MLSVTFFTVSAHPASLRLLPDCYVKCTTISITSRTRSLGTIGWRREPDALGIHKLTGSRVLDFWSNGLAMSVIRPCVIVVQGCRDSDTIFLLPYKGI